MFSKMKSLLTLTLIVLLFAFVLQYGVTHNYEDFEYIYVNVHAAAGENGIGEDDIGNYTDYWTYGSTSLSTPSEIQGDDSYITYCGQSMRVPGKKYYQKFFRFEGEAFTGKAIYGTHRYYTENGDNVTVWADQSATAYYTDENGQADSVNHSHLADVEVPPGGSAVNEIP